jgi:hypothetical protein
MLYTKGRKDANLRVPSQQELGPIPIRFVSVALYLHDLFGFHHKFALTFGIILSQIELEKKY